MVFYQKKIKKIIHALFFFNIREMSLICEILGQFSIENKVIWDCFDFSLLFSVIGLENHRSTFLTNQLQNTI